MRYKDIIRYALPTLWNLILIALQPTPIHRRMLQGKFRRFWLVHFRRRYVEEVLLPRRTNTCQRTGACCQLGFGCPAFDKKNSLCKIHPYKPLSCKLYPITPEDLEERNLIYPNKSCGYSFISEGSLAISEGSLSSSAGGSKEGSGDSAG